MDVYNPNARRRSASRLVSLDPEPRPDGGPAGDAWRPWLAADHRSRPANQAAFRIDFAAWLGTLPRGGGGRPSCWPGAHHRRLVAPPWG